MAYRNHDDWYRFTSCNHAGGSAMIASKRLWASSSIIGNRGRSPPSKTNISSGDSSSSYSNSSHFSSQNILQSSSPQTFMASTAVAMLCTVTEFTVPRSFAIKIGVMGMYRYYLAPFYCHNKINFKAQDFSPLVVTGLVKSTSAGHESHIIGTGILFRTD